MQSTQHFLKQLSQGNKMKGSVDGSHINNTDSDITQSCITTKYSHQKLSTSYQGRSMQMGYWKV
jgi:hypothetical protein